MDAKRHHYPRILIVDDNARVRAALRLCLKDEESWVVCGEAEDGDAAIELVRTAKPDVVLLDYAMPVMNGLEAARIMSGLAPECAILMYTMFATPQLSELATAAGVRAVLSKDVKWDRCGHGGDRSGGFRQCYKLRTLKPLFTLAINS